MARAHPLADYSDMPRDLQSGEWQALRGELVALLDQVEGRYARTEPREPALNGLAQRVRNLRDQVESSEPSSRRREALRTVKRAVDRFSERDEASREDEPTDALSDAIAEIRGRQMSAPAAALGRRASDMPEFRELSKLVTGISGRLERLETELKTQRNGDGVREVADQVEQLTHVVELLAGAVGETGQVKRLESQIGTLAAMIEQGPKVDLSAINKRLDDVSATVGKLAELQAQQMERELARDERPAPADDAAQSLAPAMTAIEKSVRNVYDRIDAIEKNVALSAGDLDRLIAEMAAFTQAMKDREAVPSKLVAKVDALAARIGDYETSNGDVVGLKQDITALRDAVLAGFEPRFTQIENRIDALSERITAPADTAQVENQLKLLMQRMDETSAQLDGLSRLQPSQPDAADMEAMATLVAERTTDALTRKAPAPVAMFGPDSLKSIEDRISGLIKSAGKTPDMDALAALVAEKTSEAVAKTAPQSSAPGGLTAQDMSALEERMAALFNTAGKDTAERLNRLEAALAGRGDSKTAPAPSAISAPPAADPKDRLDAMLASLGAAPRDDAMPANPADEAPLVDPGFGDPVPSQLSRGSKPVERATAPAPELAARPHFDPAMVERPPRPQSSFAKAEANPFGPPPMTAAPAPEVAPASATSTFVAAARRAQRARQETPVPAVSNSLIGRALARVMPGQSADTAAAPESAPKAEKPARPVKPPRQPKPAKVKAEAAPAPESIGMAADEPAKQSFLVRHRRPLLLTAALVVVSMLALNLVMQRMNARPQQAAPAVEATPSPASPEPAATEDVSLVKPDPRVIDLIDNSATASIDPAVSGTFAKPAPSTAMPPALASLSTTSRPVIVTDPADEISMEQTGSIPTADAAVVTFDPPPEAVGPQELREAAANGDARAQFEVGAIYTEGRAIEQDYAEAAKWYERAAARGFVPAQYRLGNLYETGTGVEQDMELARLWYQRAAEAGNRMAMHNLAALYAGGQLGDQQFETAAEWFSKAADLGMTDSQFNLGMLYARGLGVEQDFEQSYKWFGLAALRGDADAAKARNDIAKSLTADAVSRLDSEISAWAAQSVDLAANFAPIGTWSPQFDPGETIGGKDVVIKVQEALTRLGFDVGAPDGIAGAKTAEAIKAFERGTGMSEMGAINPRLLAVLGSQPV